MPVDQIRANQAPRTTQSSLAMHRNILSTYGDHLVSEVNKLPDKLEGRAGPVGEDHIEVFHAQSGEVFCRIEFGVEADHEADVSDLEVNEDILEGDG